jgi:hypothetical protein
MFLSPKLFTPALLSSSVLFSGYQGSYPWGRGAKVEASHLPPSCAKVKNGWSYILLLLNVLICVDRDNFTFYILPGCVHYDNMTLCCILVHNIFCPPKESLKSLLSPEYCLLQS